ncbi:MAG: DUF262 domain-containing protein [Rhodoferax sp.]|nr:DUF262 domain-containing protein [Rhodoferax sp.]
MEAIQAKLLDFLRKSPQFVIPIYQRNYSWTSEQCHQLWSDLMRAGRDERVPAHFIGSIVYVERGQSLVTRREALLVIDGQQRLTTSTLLIAALAEHFRKQGLGELLEAFSNEKLRNYYLLNPYEGGERHFKLILSETDKDTLLAILQNTPMPAEFSRRITENYALFQKLIEANQGELKAICVGSTSTDGRRAECLPTRRRQTRPAIQRVRPPKSARWPHARLVRDTAQEGTGTRSVRQRSVPKALCGL